MRASSNSSKQEKLVSITRYPEGLKFRPERCPELCPHKERAAERAQFRAAFRTKFRRGSQRRQFVTGNLATLSLAAAVFVWQKKFFLFCLGRD
jgi:hypothetical protein